MPSECGILEAVEPLDLAVAPDADAAGQARSVAVERHDQRLVEAAGVVGVGGVAEVVLDALELAASPTSARPASSSCCHLKVELRRVAAPLLGSALGDVARHDALARQHAVREVLQQALFLLFVRIAEARNRLAPRGNAPLRALNLARWSRPSPCLLQELALPLAGCARTAASPRRTAETDRRRGRSPPASCRCDPARPRAPATESRPAA